MPRALPHAPEELTRDRLPRLGEGIGKVVYASGDYAGLDSPLPDIPFEWSPIAHFGAYQQVPETGVRQAQSFIEAVEDSEVERQWRERRQGASVMERHADRGGCE